MVRKQMPSRDVQSRAASVSIVRYEQSDQASPRARPRCSLFCQLPILDRRQMCCNHLHSPTLAESSSALFYLVSNACHP